MPTPEARDDQEDRYERDRRNDREDDRQPIKRCMGVMALEGKHHAAIWVVFWDLKWGTKGPNTSKYVQIHHKSLYIYIHIYGQNIVTKELYLFILILDSLQFTCYVA